MTEKLTSERIRSADPTDPARMSALCARLLARKGDPDAWMAAETIRVLAGDEFDRLGRALNKAWSAGADGK